MNSSTGRESVSSLEKNNNSNKKWSDFKAYHHPPSQTREPQGIITGPEKTLSVAF